MRFMPEEDAIRALALFDEAMETGKITKKALKSWVVCLSYLPNIPQQCDVDKIQSERQFS